MCRWKWLITLTRINKYQASVFNCSQIPKWSSWWKGTGHVWEVSDLQASQGLRLFGQEIWHEWSPLWKLQLRRPIWQNSLISLTDWRETYLQMNSSVPKVLPFPSYKTAWSPCHIHFLKEQFHFWRGSSSFCYFHISINFDHIMWLL